ncbi:MAG: (d)CMP kinase [Candidatus Hydrogenedentes bacterium]|nr:(d)CMP kinase [Candidatus Hydrogenedentota bacterium]
MTDHTDIIAIDGPAGAGKSTTAKRVAAALGYAFLDTGAMYRAATWWAMEQGVDLDDPAAVAAATRALPLRMEEHDGRARVFVGDRDVTEAIRSPEVTRCIFKLDQNPDVRAHLVALQRAFGARQPTVAEGRDIGTVVFPQAKCKVYLDASLDERARRRAAEMAGKGKTVSPDALRAEIHERDEKSKTRAVSPLRRAEDAVLIDTTSMTQDEVVAAIVELARRAQ